jgi:sugar/nucleoside kinase (ribokinase family)
MCGKHDSLKDVNWPRLVAHRPEEKLLAAFAGASLIALVNWTMLPLMGGILQKLLTRIAPQLEGEKRWLFFDLADPAKRTREDIASLLRTVSRFQRFFKVVLGLNWQEARQIGEVLGVEPPAETYGTVTDHASRILDRLKIDTVVVHPTSFASAADANGSAFVVGPFIAKPKITTGAGDHFNSGFCIGRLIGADLATSLQLGVATSGFYVRQAKSPRVDDLRRFLGTL